MNAVYATSYEIDQKHGTEYHGRFLEFLKHVQANDLMSCGAMTDTKGDRGLSPGQQPDPDQYLHIVERRKNGIVVRGAKTHQTGAVNSHEIIAMPTTALGPGEEDYAISFAVPADTPGLVYIFGRQTNDSRKIESAMDAGNPRYGAVGGEALVVFDNVFVPRERVFMCGEYEFAYPLVEKFAALHRQNYGGCKGGVADVIIGAAATLAEYQGVSRAAHVRDKLTEMVHLAETLYCCSIACSSEGSPTPSGSWGVDTTLANISKHNVTRFIYEIARLAQDLAGGFMATMPSERDLRHPEVGEYVQKYLQAAAGAPAEHRMRMGRLIESLTTGIALVESMHGAGSPQAQRVMILRQADLESKKKLALRLARIDA
jgi:4-hydroxybutyryl-CoA dehydratase/vinylacetyl-CoA-Delta-isomerase